MNTNSKILIVAPTWIGDTVMAQSLFKLLKQHAPNCELHVLAAAHLLPLLALMPEITLTIKSPFKPGSLSLRERYHLGRQLRAAAYSQAIVLPNSFKSALVPWFAKILARRGWRGEMRYGLINDLRVLNVTQYPLMWQRYIALGLGFGATLPEINGLRPALKVTSALISQALARVNLSSLARPVLAICPGAEYGPAKRWPPKYFAEVAAAKAQAGWDIWIFGGPKEQVIAQEIQRVSNNVCVDLTGKTALDESIALLSLSKAAISNDSGLMHVIAALDLPLLAIYGSSSPGFTPPLSNKAQILALDLACRPCFKRECSYGHYQCLYDLLPQQVLVAGFK